MFRKILIANRGEIAVRIIRAARELGIATVAVYSTADKEALHTLLADEAICIGPGKATESYLNINAILSAAVLTEAEAIHPGFGFLSENSKFATMCEEVGIKFIGPSAHVMDIMGDKINARAQMIKANVPVIPGSDGEVHTAEEALAVAEKIGYPLLRSQLITRVTSELMMRTREPDMRRFINNQHAAYFGAFGSRKGVLQAYEVSISATAAEFAPQIQVPVQMLVAEDDDDFYKTRVITPVRDNNY